jgi:hypothetical protein
MLDPVIRWLMTKARGLTDSNEFLDILARQPRTAWPDHGPAREITAPAE